jgi:hypothetical protein
MDVTCVVNNYKDTIYLLDMTLIFYSDKDTY